MTDERRFILCSPTERGEHMNTLRRVMDPTISALCEQRGVDFMWPVQGEWWGIQRKTIADLWASVDDGRLNVELGQISTEIHHAVFIIEGKLMATVEGLFTAGRTSRSVGTHIKALMTLASKGMTVVQTETAQHTGFAVAAIAQWTREAKHSIGATRPKAVGKWGRADSREWGVHFLQGFPGIGADSAAAIVDVYGVPLQWTIGEGELRQVPGIGRGRAEKLIAALA